MTDDPPLTDELKPCPFCGATLEHDAKIDQIRHPKHDDCPARSFSCADDRRDVFAAWNRRTIPAAVGHREKRAQELLLRAFGVGQFTEGQCAAVASAFAAVAEAEREKAAHWPEAVGRSLRAEAEQLSNKPDREYIQGRAAIYDECAAAIRTLKDEA